MVSAATDPRRVAAALSACEGVPTSVLESKPQASDRGLLANALAAVFFDYIDGADFEYLRGGDFDAEDPEDVRADFAEAIECTLGRVQLESTAENCGAVGDMILLQLPALASFFEETTDQ